MEARRLEILKAAARAFRAQGFAAAGMRDIAVAADLSPGNLYHYFRGKHEILFFCQDRALDRLLAALEDARRGRASLPERLRVLARAHVLCLVDEIEGSAAHLEAAGMKTKVLASPEATELAKLTETTYLGLLIAFAQDVDRMGRAVGVSYSDVASFYDEIGYLPRVGFFPGIIGGHCVIPNVALLKRRFQSELLDAIEWSNELRKAEG